MSLTFLLCQLADSFDDRGADPDIKPAALFRSQSAPGVPGPLHSLCVVA